MRGRCIYLLVLITLALTSCDQKELGYWSEISACRYEIVASYDSQWYVLPYEGEGRDWAEEWDETEFKMSYESLLPAEPEGLRVILYDSNDKRNELNLPTHGGEISLNPGTYSLMLYNNDTEYIVFNDLHQAAQATASTRARSRSAYRGSQYVRSEANENTITAPDMLYACHGGDFTATESDEDLRLEYELRPLVYKYLVRYHFSEGLQYVVLARGALAGVGASVYLTDGRTSSQEATILYDIDMQNLEITDAETGQGFLYAVVNSFGVPGYPNDYYSRGDPAHGLNLELALTNFDTVNYDFDITEQMQQQPRGGVIDVYGISISEPEMKEELGSFDVGLSDWNDNIDIIL